MPPTSGSPIPGPPIPELLAPESSELGLSRAAVRHTVRAFARFVVRNGGFATAVVERTGCRGARVVLVGVNGTWGDYVLPSVPAAQQICRFAGLEVSPAWSRELTARMAARRRPNWEDCPSGAVGQPGW